MVYIYIIERTFPPRPSIAHSDQLLPPPQSISGIYTLDFADRVKAKMAIIHVTSDQTESEQFQLVNMETSSSAHGRLDDVRRYSINLEDQRIMPVNPLG